jgi:hypothetical protein
LHSQKSQPLFSASQEPKIEASKSLGLGDLLSFLQKHLNQILQYKNPEYTFEFVGYERDDPKLSLDLDEGELRSWKTLNEKRAEKGSEPIDLTKVKNPADLPMNVQAVQLWQSQQQGGMGGMDGFGMGDDDEDADFDDEDEEAGADEGGAGGEEGEGGSAPPEDAGDSGWDEIEAQHGGAVNKSMSGQRGMVRIVI